MKKRLGFVSNSSSSSFCIAGVMFPVNGDENDYSNCHKGILKIYKDYKKNSKFSDENISDYMYSCIDKDKQCKLTIARGIDVYSDEDQILGFNIQNIRDDQTFGEFKQQICNHINTCFDLQEDNMIQPKDIEIYVDGGYNG